MQAPVLIADDVSAAGPQRWSLIQIVRLNRVCMQKIHECMFQLFGFGRHRGGNLGVLVCVSLDGLFMQIRRKVDAAISV